MILVEDLTFQYGRSAPLITSLSRQFDSGRVHALIGPSGSGKSTLLYILGLLLRPTSGRVVIDGSEAQNLPDAARSELRARHIGFVFQDALLDASRTVLENVLEGGMYLRRRPTDQDALDLLARFGVTAPASRRPGQISGGQAQRVALCRALVKRPPVILADEPTGNLDSATAAVVWGALREHARNGAVVIVATHDRTRADDCDEIVDVSHAA